MSGDDCPPEYGDEDVENETTKNGSRIRLYFIRHGETAGNLEKRYVGRTDEPLCPAGRESVRRREADIKNFPALFEIYVSPMRRCLETAALLFSGAEESFCRIPDFRECDFGLFEGRNYRELISDEKLAPLYQAWIDSGGTMPFPGGEAPDDFRKRCVRAFEKIMAQETGKSVVFVVHGGTIMSILAAFGEPQKGYYDYQVPCAQGYACDYLPGRGVITNIVKL